MIELIPDLPDNVVGIRASGQVTADDYHNVVVPAVEAALKRHEGIRILYQISPSFSGFSGGALWDDVKLGFAHLRAWGRIAIVTDSEWIAGATHMFAFAVPCPSKVFSNVALDDAKRWIVE